jgi:hypothetical protein
VRPRYCGDLLDLNVPPWAGVDGPSLAGCAAALQLLPENIPFLIRLQRLASVGAALPPARDARPLSPSRLRALLRDPLISGEDVRREEDPYEDLYVEEVIFHNGPSLVIQGLTNHSAHTLRILLNAMFRLRDNGLPEEYLNYARLLVPAVLALSDTACGRAGLKRGTTAPQVRPRDPLTPGAARLAQLCGAVTFTAQDLTSLLPEGAMEVLAGWVSDAGTHRLGIGSDVTDNGILLRPLLRHGLTLIVVNPGELASALRHHLIVTAGRYGCRDKLAMAFRRTAAAAAQELLSVINAEPRAPFTEAAPLVLRQVFDGVSGTIVDLGVLTDDLSNYDPADPFGYWNIPNAGQPLQDCLDPPGPPGEDDERTLRLAVIDDLARVQPIGLEESRRPGPLLAVRLNELQVMVDLDSSDPLFLWRFAQAQERFHDTTQVQFWSVLDAYSIYRSHEDSFYLNDERAPTGVFIEPGCGAPLRAEAQRKLDRHFIPGPDGGKFVEVMAVYGTDTAPIYFAHPRHGLMALAVEFPEATAWVLYDGEFGEMLSMLIFTVLKAAAYWIWQLAAARPGILAGAAGPRRRLRVTLAPDDPARWDQVLTGQHEDNLDVPEDDPDVAAASWVAVSEASSGKLAVTLVAEHAAVLLSSTNLADRQLTAALASGLAPGDTPAQTAALAGQVAPYGAKRMIHVWLSGDVLLAPTDVLARTVRPAVTATVLDDLGDWLAAQEIPPGTVASDRRTEILNKAVEYCYQRLVKTVAGLAPEGLMEYLVYQDEALLHDLHARAKRLPSQLACFGHDSVQADELRDQESKAIQAAMASRFLIEYTAATPPDGTTRINLMMYDELLALAAELISRATLSDAIQYGFSQVELSMLPSGRLGVSLDDRYTAGTQAVAAAMAEARHAFAIGPAPTADAGPQPSADAATRARVDNAMQAEFGFTMTQLIDGLSELAALSSDRGRGPTTEPVGQVLSVLQDLPGWDKGTAEALLEKLTLRPRKKFLSPGAEAYPWKFNRDLSYIRRPLIETTGPDGESLLMWSSRRTWFAARYWTELIHTGRLRATTQAMKTLMGTIRQDQNTAFERDVATILAQAGMPVTGTGLKRISGQRLLSPDGADLGDIDAIALDPSSRTIIVAEAKDFELARTPSELANEADDLLIGDKSAVHKLSRRASWVQSHTALVLRHFGIAADPAGWHIAPVIVTSRRLLSPNVLQGPIPVVTRDELPAWTRRQCSHPQRRRRRH